MPDAIELGEVGTRDGVPLRFWLDGQGSLSFGDPRVRVGGRTMASLNTDQQDDLIKLLVAAKTAERPKPDVGELVQPGEASESPAPTGPVEPLHR